MELQLLEEAEGLRRWERLEQLDRLLTATGLDQEQRRAEAVAPLHQPVDLEGANAIHRAGVAGALVGLSRRAQLAGAFPGQPGLVELAGSLVELGHFLEAAGADV